MPLIFICAGCAEWADHGPVSARTQEQMEVLAVGKEDFMRKMKPRLSPPSRPVGLPIKLSNGIPLVEASINGGATTTFMMDTGASRSVIQARTVVDKKVTLLKATDASVKMQGVVGHEEGRIGLIDRLDLGGWVVNSYPCLVRTYENRVVNRQREVVFPSSIIGFDLALRHCSWLTLDYRAKSLTFAFQGKYTPPKSRFASTPFVIKNDIPYITLKSGQYSWQAIVDSGSFNGVEINEAVATRLGVQDKGEPIRGLFLMSIGGTVTSGQVKMRTVDLPDLELVGEKYKSAQVDISPGPPRVGSHFLKDYRVTFDFRRKVMWLEW